MSSRSLRERVEIHGRRCLLQEAGKSMSHDAQFTHAHMVRFERSIEATPDKVWSVLTNVRLLPGWYGEGVHRAQGRRQGRADGRSHPRNRHPAPAARASSPTPGTSSHRASRSSPFPESYLTLELAPKDGGTVLTLTHLPVLEPFVKLNAMGWHTFLDMVDAAVARRAGRAARGLHEAQRRALRSRSLQASEVRPAPCPRRPPWSAAAAA